MIARLHSCYSPPCGCSRRSPPRAGRGTSCGGRAPLHQTGQLAARARTSPSFSPSTMTRSTGSVPDGRSSTRPALAQLALRRLRMRPRLRRCSSSRSRAATRTLTSTCGYSVRPPASSASGLPCSAHRGQHLQRRDDAVAGGVLVEADDVARSSRRRAASRAPAASRARSGRRPWRGAKAMPVASSACSSARLVISVPATPSHLAARRAMQRDHVEQLVAVVGAAVARRPSAGGRRRRPARCRGRPDAGCTARVQAAGVRWRRRRR